MAKIVFMGTPDFAVPTLKALLVHHEVLAAVTQPDRPAGRRKQLRPSPVKRMAVAAGLPVFQPQRIRQSQAMDVLGQWDADFFVVAAFGQILPPAVLGLPKRAAVNVHASLLPRWRGAAPIQAAIRAGDAKSGITIMVMDAGLDTGPMLAKRSIPIERDETGQSLHDKLAVLGAELLIETLPKYLAGKIEPQAQDESRASYAPRIKKEEGRIDWTQPAVAIERLVRAFRPWPGAFTGWNSRRLAIHAGREGPGSASPGQVIEQGGQIAIGAGAGLYYPTELQLAGKRRMPPGDLVNGYSDFVGAVLGN